MEFKFVCALMFCEISRAATLAILLMAAADKVCTLPRAGLQGAKPIVVGNFSTRVQLSATTAVAMPLVVVFSATVVTALAVVASKDCK